MKARCAPAILLALLAAPAFAQRTELSLLGGHTTAGDIDQKALGIQKLQVAGGFSWAVTAGHFFSEHVGAEASWTQQGSDLAIGTADGDAELFDMKIGALQGSFVYQFGAGEARLRPFLAAGIGATFLSAEDLDSETKLGWSVGGGLKWFPSRRIGVRAQARYVPTQLSDSGAEVCDPFGFCQGSLHQFDFLGGVVVRF